MNSVSVNVAYDCDDGASRGSLQRIKPPPCIGNAISRENFIAELASADALDNKSLVYNFVTSKEFARILDSLYGRYQEELISLDYEEKLMNRSWGKNNNPKSALNKYLKKIKQVPTFDLNKQKINFEIDKSIDSQILISVAPGGFLKRL